MLHQSNLSIFLLQLLLERELRARAGGPGADAGDVRHLAALVRHELQRQRRLRDADAAGQLHREHHHRPVRPPAPGGLGPGQETQMHLVSFTQGLITNDVSKFFQQLDPRLDPLPSPFPLSFFLISLKLMSCGVVHC